jgi:hypothetical protein
LKPGVNILVDCFKFYHDFALNEWQIYTGLPIIMPARYSHKTHKIDKLFRTGRPVMKKGVRNRMGGWPAGITGKVNIQACIKQSGLVCEDTNQGRGMGGWTAGITGKVNIQACIKQSGQLVCEDTN